MARGIEFEKTTNVRESLQDVVGGTLTIEEKLKAFKKLGIEVVRDIKVWENPWHYYMPINCFAYALGLEHSEEYQRMHYETRSFASSDFVAALDQYHCLRKVESPSVNDLVMYFNKDGHPTHLGVICAVLPEIMVESAWGDLEKVFRHKLMDVITEYGDRVKFYLPLDQVQAESYFREYAIVQKIAKELEGNKRLETLMQEFDGESTPVL